MSLERKSSKQREKFDMSEEPEDLAVTRRDIVSFDQKRYNPSIIINSKLFRAPEKFLGGSEAKTKG